MRASCPPPTTPTRSAMPLLPSPPSFRTRAGARPTARRGSGAGPAGADAGGSGWASRCARIWLTSTWSTSASCTRSTLGMFDEAQRLVDAVRERQRAGAPHPLQDAAAHLDRVPAHVRELAAARGEDPAPLDHAARRDRVDVRPPREERQEHEQEHDAAGRGQQHPVLERRRQVAVEAAAGAGDGDEHERRPERGAARARGTARRAARESARRAPASAGGRRS